MDRSPAAFLTPGREQMVDFDPIPSSSLRFAHFELDVRTLELRRNGELIPLQPRPARVLAALAQAAGELVTRRELRDQVWGDNENVDFEQSLKTCIKQIRGILGDDARAPRFVETLPRRGYRFVGTVRFPAQAKTPTAKAPHGAAGLRRPSVTELALVSVVVLLLLLLLRSSLVGEAVVPTQRNLPARESANATVEHPAAAAAKWREALPDVGSDDPSALATAIDLLREAKQIDPYFAPIHVALARAYLHLPLSAAERLPAANEAIDEALRIDPTLAAAFEIRGYLRFHYDHDWPGARSDLEESIRLDPHATGAMRVLAYWHAATGQPADANALIERAVKLEPGAAEIHADAGWMHYYGRRYQEAIQSCGTALKLNARAESAEYCILLSELGRGDTPEAARRARRRLVSLDTPAAVLARFDAATPEQAMRQFWLLELEALRKSERYGATSTFRRLLALVMLDRQDDAIDVLRGDGGACDPPVLPFLGVAPYLDPLRDTAPFRRLVEEFRLPEDSPRR